MLPADPEPPTLPTCPPQLGDTSLPEEDPTTIAEDGTESEMDEELLQKLHHVLLEVCGSVFWFFPSFLLPCPALPIPPAHPITSQLTTTAPTLIQPLPPPQMHVQDGSMVCPSCGHVYAIVDGIPNMVGRSRGLDMTSRLSSVSLTDPLTGRPCLSLGPLLIPSFSNRSLLPLQLLAEHEIRR